VVIDDAYVATEKTLQDFGKCSLDTWASKVFEPYTSKEFY